MTTHRLIISLLCAFLAATATVSMNVLGENKTNANSPDVNSTPPTQSRIIYQLAKAGSKDDGKASPAGQAKAAQKALKKSKGKVLKVQRGEGGYTVKVLTGSGKVQQIWIAD
ncbi:hypothetical protein [Pseudoteredinibacter isoporae]|uniref:Flagellar hook assembly protein FlgD n=1 Tax=Pseudoteredinibacter isoporae TaxID=570281 RepID=A0A7X0JWT2_9GAMM|nr:hypothetical protein [Pseudoteredinibacter isoporae]MBB6522955.1 flagellar hook assembly protein FlgD [Pseudoteredinibacter isoporae]NHO88479.1 hypothetical protein [Pseudoteredinibacter isoporae]NIB22122.1 hypothetical protein [Pseudoteredinibacter isoporae]